MFEARISRGRDFKRLIDAISQLTVNANFDCSSDGVSLQALDSSNVAMVVVELKAEGFEYYRADRSVSLGINLASMSKVLKWCGDDDMLTIKADEASGDEVTLMFESPNQTRVSMFNLKLMDIDVERMEIPETEHHCVVRMASTEFKRIISEISILGHTVRISASKDGVRFSVNGDSGTGSIVCKKNEAVDSDEEQQIRITRKEDVSLSLALKYLSSFTKATPLSRSVTLRMNPDKPLVVEYDIFGDLNGYVRYYLGPKMDDDEEEGIL
jgi:proliferating cell nuclear antigen